MATSAAQSAVTEDVFINRSFSVRLSFYHRNISSVLRGSTFIY